MSLAVRKLADSEVLQWDDFVQRHEQGSNYHRSAWKGFFEKSMRKETHYLAAWQRDEITGVLPLVRQKSLVFGDYLVSLPFLNYGGLLSTSEAATAALVDAMNDLAADLGVSHAELRGLARVLDLPVKTNKVAMHLRLPADADELSSSLGAKLRSQIRRPQRHNPVVKRGGADRLDDFYRVFSRNMRDLGTPVYGKKMFADILERFADSSDIVVIEIDGTPVAAGFLLSHRGMTEVPWASSDRRYNKLSVNMLLYWEMLRTSIERGSRIFDFGRSSVDSGTFRFKKQWGAEPVQLFWSYWLAAGQQLPELNPENSRYALAIRAWQRLPVPLTQAIGPMLARNLP